MTVPVGRLRTAFSEDEPRGNCDRLPGLAWREAGPDPILSLACARDIGIGKQIPPFQGGHGTGGWVLPVCCDALIHADESGGEDKPYPNGRS